MIKYPYLINLSTIINIILCFWCYAVRYLVPTSTSNWARYVDRIRLQVQTRVNQYRSLKVLPNKLTPVYSKNHYKEENYLKVKIIIFKYITPLYSNGCYIPTFLRTLRTELVSSIHGFVQYIAHDQSCDLATPYPIALLVLLVLRPVH